MSLNKLGFEVQRKIYPIELIDKAYNQVFNIFQLMAKSKFGYEQQKFWSTKPNVHESEIDTLRINDADKVLQDNTLSQIISLSSVAISKTCQDGLSYGFTSCHSFFKSPLTGKETPWHQDPAYSNKNIKYNNITCWIPLCNVDKESSCLEFLKGSHKSKELLPHLRINNSENSALQAVFKSSKEDIATVPLNKGDSVFHRSYVAHRSTANKKSNCRIALILIYSPIT